MCGYPQRETPSGVTCRNGHGGVDPLSPAVKRHTFEAKSMEDAAHMLGAAAGAYCFVCSRTPKPEHLTYKHLAVCALCAPAARQRELMTMNDLNDAEEAAAMDGVDRAGSYLASIDKFDLRDLSEQELKSFNAHFLCGYSESMRERARDAPPF